MCRSSARTGYVVLDQRADGRLVEVRRTTGVRPRPRDDVVHHRGGVGRVRHGGDVLVEIRRRRRQPVRARAAGRERQRGDPARVVHAGDETDAARPRPAHDVRPLDAQRVQDAQRVLGQVGERVARPPRREVRRSTGVAVVVADHEPAAGRDPFAQLGFPPQHRRGRSHDQ